MEAMDVDGAVAGESKMAASANGAGSSSRKGGAAGAVAGAGAAAAGENGTANGNDTVDAPNFDLDSYAARYTGYTKVQRLLFIAQHCKGRELDAYRLALEELKRGTNTAMYKRVQGLVKGRLGEAYAPDQAWVDAVEKRAAATKERLESDLQASRTSMSKESIRLGYNDLGEFFYQRGDLDAALKHFVRTRDYCSMTRHSVDMCLNVVKVSVALGSFAHVSNYVAKAEHTPDVTDPRAVAKLRAAAGLALLHQGNYAAAARKFLECDPDHLAQAKPPAAASSPAASGAAAPAPASASAAGSGSGEPPSAFSQVIAPEDVAVYGGMCALASFDRGELKRRVVENMAFKAFLDLVPPMRELLADFCASRYGPCLRYLDELRPELLLDVHLRPHVAALYAKARERCLLQFFAPYLSVDLQRMAAAFHCPPPQLEAEVAELIMAGRLPARVDSQGQALHRRVVHEREEGYRKAFAMGRDVLRGVRATLLRASLLERGVAVEPPARGEGGRGGRGGGGGGGGGGLVGALGGLGALASTPLQGGLLEGALGRGRDEDEDEEEEEEEDAEEVSDVEDEAGGGDPMLVSGGGGGGGNQQDPDSMTTET